MIAHHRGHFLAFALLPLLNTLGLLVHGLNLSTHGTGNTGRALAIILVSGLISMISVAVSSFKRARHLGFAPRGGARIAGLLVSRPICTVGRSLPGHCEAPRWRPGANDAPRSSPRHTLALGPGSPPGAMGGDTCCIRHSLTHPVCTLAIAPPHLSHGA